SLFETTISLIAEEGVAEEDIVVIEAQLAGDLLFERHRRRHRRLTIGNEHVVVLDLFIDARQVEVGWRPHVGMHVDDVKVEASVVARAEGAGAHAAGGSAAQGFLGYLRELAAAVVTIKLSGPEHIGNEQVHAAVAVVIEEGGVRRPSLPGQPRFLRDIDEFSPALAIRLAAVKDVELLR